MYDDEKWNGRPGSSLVEIATCKGRYEYHDKDHTPRYQLARFEIHNPNTPKAQLRLNYCVGLDPKLGTCLHCSPEFASNSKKGPRKKCYFADIVRKMSEANVT